MHILRGTLLSSQARPLRIIAVCTNAPTRIHARTQPRQKRHCYSTLTSPRRSRLANIQYSSSVLANPRFSGFPEAFTGVLRLPQRYFDHKLFALLCVSPHVPASKIHKSRGSSQSPIQASRARWHSLLLRCVALKTNRLEITKFELETRTSKAILSKDTSVSPGQERCPAHSISNNILSPFSRTTLHTYQICQVFRRFFLFRTVELSIPRNPGFSHSRFIVIVRQLWLHGATRFTLTWF